MSAPGDDDGGSRKRPSRRVVLSEEDRRLWEHVAKSVAPVGRGSGRVSKRGDEPRPPTAVPAPTSTTPGPNDPKLAERNDALAELQRYLAEGTAFIGSRADGGQPARLHSVKHQPPPIADFDRKAVRRIRSGRIEIEARIDLHGMRQDEAHSTLRSFLLGCQVRGIRWVLVITGKGRPSRPGDGHESDSGRGRTDPPWWGDERGVLKRNVPRWLTEPELRSIVVSYTTASIGHGGEGALYVHLRGRR